MPKLSKWLVRIPLDFSYPLAMQEGKKNPQEWAQATWTVLASQNQRLLKDGKPIETSDGNLEELTRQAKEFADKRMPILKALHVL